MFDLLFFSLPVLLPLLFLAAIHLGFHAPRIEETGNPRDFGFDFARLRIPTANGKRLYAWSLPGSRPAGTVIVLHGWGGNAEMMLPIAGPFHRAGYNVLLFDARGHGRSDRDTFSSLPRFAEDLCHVTDWVQNHLQDSGKIVLLGHSVGAGAVLLAASQRSDIRAVISISAFAHPDWMMRRYLAKLHLPRFLIGWMLRYVQWVIGHRFDDIAPMRTLCKIRCPVLLLHGKEDATVPSTDALAIRQGCGNDLTEVLLIDGAGHDSVEKIEQHGRQMVEFLARSGIS